MRPRGGAAVICLPGKCRRRQCDVVDFVEKVRAIVGGGREAMEQQANGGSRGPLRRGRVRGMSLLFVHSITRGQFCCRRFGRVSFGHFRCGYQAFSSAIREEDRLSFKGRVVNSC